MFFVPLAGVAEAELVEGTIAATIGIHSTDELRSRTALLVIDNFEHVIDAAPVVTSVLGAAPAVKVLATSRAPLRLAGEREYPVEPLPDADAVALLTARARAVRPDFVPDDATREVCRRLDGLPLALELVAPRLRSLSAESLLERLDKRLPLLTAGRRDAPERQRTLRATIEWSYELLPGELRTVFAQLSVFAGTFSLEAAEAVTAATLDDVDALVEASLVKSVRDGRFLMLETIREFAREQCGRDDAVAQAHAEFLAQLAQRANLHAESAGPMRHDLVLPEADNIRAALQWTVESGRGELGLTLAGALENYWVTSDPLEGRRWFEALLAIGPASPSELTALARRCLGNCVTMSGDITRGQACYEQSAAEYRELGDELRAAIVDHRVANAELTLGNLGRAVELARSGLATFEQHGWTRGEAQVMLLLGDVAARQQQGERALELYARALALARQTGFRWWEKVALFDQAATQLALGRQDDAVRSLLAGLEVAKSIADRPGLVQGALLLARTLGAAGRRQAAGLLYGCAEADVDRRPLAGWDRMKTRSHEWLAEIAGPEFEQGRAAGRTLKLDEAIARAAAW